MTAAAAIQRRFINAASFAVAGASAKDSSKFGNKILRWYIERDLPVVPIHPTESELEGVKTIHSLGELESPSTVSLSIITPPKASLKLLQESDSLSLNAIWIQPGASDDAVVEYIQATPGLANRVILGGPCLLVLGDGLLKEQKSSL